MKKLLSWLMIALSPMLVVSCKDKDNDEPEIPTLDVAKNIVGTWLLSTSDAVNWVSYEFTESSRVNAEVTQSGYYGTGSGYYSIENEKFTGSYTNDRNQTIYLDWIVSAIEPFEISIKIYDENTFAGDASLYRVVSNIEVEAGSKYTPDYRGLCGTNNLSGFNVIDGTIAEIDNYSGEITAKKEGNTFATFTTPNGTAAIKITVTEKIKTFAELIVGTWIYDAPAEYDWERFTYSDNGYIYAEWENTQYNFEESAQGLYTIDGQTVSYTLRIAAGQMNMRMVTESINDLEWTYAAYDGTHMNGKYTVQRLLDSYTLSPQGTCQPDYQSLVGTARIISFKSHDNYVATVSSTGKITAKAKGRTYIDVVTNKGTGVVEVYVDANQSSDLFTDYSVLIGMNKSAVLKRMGRNPDSSNNQSESWFFYDNKGIMIVSAYYTDFEYIYDDVKSVVTMFDNTLTVDEITKYLKSKYPYYPEYSSDNELVFIPEDQSMVIYYEPDDKMVMYISTTSTRSMPDALVKELIGRLKSTIR